MGNWGKECARYGSDSDPADRQLGIAQPALLASIVLLELLCDRANLHRPNAAASTGRSIYLWLCQESKRITQVLCLLSIRSDRAAPALAVDRSQKKTLGLR